MNKQDLIHTLVSLRDYLCSGNGKQDTLNTSTKIQTYNILSNCLVRIRDHRPIPEEYRFGLEKIVLRHLYTVDEEPFFNSSDIMYKMYYLGHLIEWSSDPTIPKQANSKNLIFISSLYNYQNLN